MNSSLYKTIRWSWLVVVVCASVGYLSGINLTPMTWALIFSFLVSCNILFSLFFVPSSR